MKSKSGSSQIHTEIPQHPQQNYSIQRELPTSKLCNYTSEGNNTDERARIASVSLSMKGRRRLKASKVGVCLKIWVGGEQTE